jgi:hypothetical protein
MQVTAISKARTLALIEIDELNRNGKVRLADCVKPLVQKFDFKRFPQNIDEFDLQKGISFGSGRLDEYVIDALMVYDGAIYVETLSSTADSQTVLLKILEWGASNLGLTYTDGMIRKWAYISNIVFYTDFPLLAQMSGPLKSLALKTSEVMESLFSGLKYQPISFQIGHDPVARKHTIASLIVQHRINTRVEENKYFSEAPLPTDLHIRFLEEFERDVQRSSTL